ncbi:MAG: hypothetical protein SPE11_10470 [Parabacteroides sp.]|nr:hypothetical protein [Parabacteroides sp.]
MAVTIKWTGLFRPMQKYKKEKEENGNGCEIWERLRERLRKILFKKSFSLLIQVLTFASQNSSIINQKYNKTHGKAK